MLNRVDELEQKVNTLCDHCQSRVYLENILNSELSKFEDLRYKVSQLQTEVSKYVEMVNRFVDYAKKLYAWCQRYVK